MKDRKKYVLWFDECDIGDVPVVGGKCASLGELLKAEIPVPPGFAVTVNAYRRFLDEGGIRDEILSLLEEIDHEDIDSVEKASKSIRELIEKTPLGMELEDYIGEFYRLLSKFCNFPAVPAAVRSSATAEDLPGASFAGQQDTFLWIRGIDDVIAHILKCWSSLFTARAIAYRSRMGFPHDKVAISVAVQKMVKAVTAGVMFTINPASGDPSSIVIDANWGFGESVVSGEATPDNFVVNKITLSIIKRTIAEKEILYTLNHETHSVEKQEIPLERKNEQCLLDDEVVELAKIGKLIEKHYGKAMDVEWAIDKDLPRSGQIMILQSRPETVWSQKKTEPVIAPKKSAMDHIIANLLEGKKVK